MECEFTGTPERSCKETTELLQSMKKVKGSSAKTSGSSLESGSYKDKLVGDMPGAFAQAFNLHEEAPDLDSSEAEVEEISDGIASVKLSSSSKQLIRGRWTHAIIIKPFGRSVGFHFLHARIMAL